MADHGPDIVALCRVPPVQTYHHTTEHATQSQADVTLPVAEQGSGGVFRRDSPAFGVGDQLQPVGREELQPGDTPQGIPAQGVTIFRCGVHRSLVVETILVIATHTIKTAQISAFQVGGGMRDTAAAVLVVLEVPAR